MKTILFLSGALTLLALHGCQTDNRERAESDQREVPAKQETPAKMIEQLVGEWEQASAGEAGNSRASGESQRTLTFTEEARYIVREGNRKTDSGAYRMNEQLRNLYLESESNEDPREYEIQLNRDTLILTSKDGSSEGGRVYVRNN